MKHRNSRIKTLANCVRHLICDTCRKLLKHCNPRIIKLPQGVLQYRTRHIYRKIPEIYKTLTR